ncbi:bifunctional diguanylate cyclase/phosphodiesterase [Alteromonas sp. 1_MG-2023]|uniref:EAL domain-containing protein n=1 Tax=Alteromonas sp. 1_MG-2023 TaxID=3062669 RepID=UPI0026E37326|nr:bifunctional diguanylate cyclase/phosphodiesterase [Alteromonas sp. 1_MG-2023]MDO6567850.1 bifunctional diguanylate cyclase/phosphodiesterase [Alteromonas sp. 1_MG-2023]
MFNRCSTLLKRYLLLDADNVRAPDADIWKLSVLRIVLLIGVTLTSAIVLHSSYAAYQQGMYYVLYLTIGFSALLYVTLGLRKGQIKLASASLTLTIVMAGLCILFFTIDIASARYGLLFFFTLPIFLRLFYGNKAAIIGMFLNLIPFALLIRNQPIAPLFGIDITLPETHTYLSSLIFMFFNFCLPMAVIRVMTSLESQSSLNLKQTKKMEKLVSRYQEIFNNGGTPSLFCDQQGKILQANKSARKLINQLPAPCNYIEQLFELHEPLSAGQRHKTHLTGNPHATFELQSASLQHHKKQLIHCFDVSEITENGRKFDAFKRQHFEKHYYDELTGLRNHHYWNSSVNQPISANTHTVMLKLANLRDINLQYGYSQGDKALAQCAMQIQNALPSSTLMYRLPGAKFLVSCQLEQEKSTDFNVWLKDKLPSTIQIKDNSELLTQPLIWVGGFVYVSKAQSPSSVAESCAIALSQASSNSNFSQFDCNVVKLIRKDTQHRDKVKRLLDNRCLALWLQPQVSINNTIVGFEALARLKDDEDGKILQPYQFLPVIEKNNWHILFTQKILDNTIELIENWPSDIPPVPVAINLSGPELLSDLFYEKLLRRYSESQFLRERLKLELTETSVLASHQETKRRLTSLANVGATIIIDDFGTGHASLSQLIDMSASVLKVDREFIDRIDSSERHRKIVQMTLELAKSLDMQTIAEGVETQAQLNLLIDMGFTLFQGYLYGKPAPIEAWQGMSKAITVGKSAIQ